VPTGAASVAKRVSSVGADASPTRSIDGIGVDSKVTPEAPVSTKDFEKHMTYVITEPCIGVKDASCVDVCPVDCIHATDDDAMFFIDPDECIDCGACEPECPVTAIFAEDAVPDDQQKYIQINADYFKQ